MMCKCMLCYSKALKDKLTELNKKLTHIGDVAGQLSTRLDSVASTHVADRKMSLDDRAVKLQSRLHELSAQLESIMDDRSKFTQKFQAIETLLKSLPAEESRLSAVNIPVVKESISAAKEVRVKLDNMQPDITELNKLGSELSLTDDDATRLAELNKRWELTCADREKEENELEDRLAELKNLSDRCHEWTVFVSDIEKQTAELPVCSYESLLVEQQKLEVDLSNCSGDIVIVYLFIKVIRYSVI